MDYRSVWPGQVPMVMDLLQTQKNIADALASMAAQVFGRGGITGNAAYGFQIGLSGSALTVTVGTGSILTPAQAVPAAMSGGASVGGMDADPTSVMKQFLNVAPVSVTVPAPGATWTLYALCADTDTDNTVLPFFNASNPSVSQAGQQNSGAALPTRRASCMTFQLAQNVPAAPAGGTVVALGTIAVPSGATNTTGATWTPDPSAFWDTLPQLQTAFTAFTAYVRPRVLDTVQQEVLDNGGYPFNAIVADGNTPGLFWRSTVAGNTSAPGAGGTGWAGIMTDATQLQWNTCLASTTVSIPAWARGVELKVIGGGGSGAYCYSSGTTQVSGGGGGAGGFAHGAYYPGPGTQLTLTVGAEGGNTSVAWNGNTGILCYGGGNAAWPTNWSSPGGDGGNAAGGNIMNVEGGRGTDGMAGTSANGSVAYNIGARGAASQFGEGGRAGQGGGADATGYGAGGGGAYDLTGASKVYDGGSGAQGCIMYRWLP